MSWESIAIIWQSAWTVICFVFFVGVIVWVARPGIRDHMEAAARIPLEDEEPAYRGEGS